MLILKLDDASIAKQCFYYFVCYDLYIIKNMNKENYIILLNIIPNNYWDIFSQLLYTIQIL